MRTILLLVCFGLQGATTMQLEMYSAIRCINPHLTDREAIEYQDAIKEYSYVYGVDPKLTASIIAAESSFRRKAIGKDGEIGLMQLKPKYHFLQVKNPLLRRKMLFDTHHNIGNGVKYLHSLQEVFKPRFGERWIEFYNRGPGGRVPKKFRYTERVMQFYQIFNKTI